MNERIKELILQAGFEPHYEPDGTFSYSEQFEKFAELIVAECANRIAGHLPNERGDDWTDGFHSGVHRAIDCILELKNDKPCN